MYQPRDRVALERMAAASGFPYIAPDDAMVEAVVVVVDEHDKPIHAVAAKRMVETYGWFDNSVDGITKMAAMRLSHDGMITCLRLKGYDSGVAFLPPSICERFGRRLKKHFGWTPTWKSWAINFGRD